MACLMAFFFLKTRSGKLAKQIACEGQGGGTSRSCAKLRIISDFFRAQVYNCVSHRGAGFVDFQPRPNGWSRDLSRALNFALASRGRDLCLGPLCCSATEPTKTTTLHINDRKAAHWPACVSMIHRSPWSMSVTVKDLLDAGVHFGHQTKRWNPRSKPYVFDHRQGISIIDLGKTRQGPRKRPARIIEETVGNGGNLLFVGTKRQARNRPRGCDLEPTCRTASTAGSAARLTNYRDRQALHCQVQEVPGHGDQRRDGTSCRRRKSPRSSARLTRMTRNFNGIADMGDLPSATFIVDVNHEEIAVAEGNRVATSRRSALR